MNINKGEVFIMLMDLDFYENRFLMFVVDAMANDLEGQGKDVIRMTLGKSELPLHPEINKAMEKALYDFRKSTYVFPGGLPELKDRLASHYLERYQVNIADKNIIIGAGTSSLFRNIFQLQLKPGDEVLLPLPYYSLYHFSALLVGASIKYYKINTETLSIDMSSFRENFTPKTKIVIINSPGNPLGNIVTKEEWLEIDEIVNGQALIVSDEIYDNACFEEGFMSAIQLQNTKSSFIITNAFSKGYRMYARRVGYCIVPDNLIEPLTVIQHHTLLTLDPVVQYGAIEALNQQNEVEILVNTYKERCAYTISRFKEVLDVKAIPSKGGFYLTLDCKEYMKKNSIDTSLDLAKLILEKIFVGVVPGSDFGLPNTLRLSFSTSKYNEGIDRLVNFFS